MRLPISTYRIQFNSEFGFDHAKKIISYLADLGISDLYVSPIFKARAGSTHGYDVVDPNCLNPELGSEESFEQLTQELQNHRMGWLQDIVPNHMAYDSLNRYLMDILENGPTSDYISYFDIAWNHPLGDRHDPILAALLGDFYGTCLERGEIQLKYDQNGLTANYYSLSIPLRLESYPTFLTHNLEKLSKSLGRQHPDFIKLLGILYMLKSTPSDVTGKQRQDQNAFTKGLLWELYNSNSEVKEFIDENLHDFNGEPGKPESFNLLDKLLTDQFFRLAYWKVGADEMNYRRFFTVNELISVRVEELKVFNDTHDLIFKLVQEGKFTGLRIDHIDGLYNPSEYLERLRNKVGDTYITVEKILQPGENLPNFWDVQGTSGYDFLNYINGLFCKAESQEKFDQIYREFSKVQTDFEQLVSEKKQFILASNLAGDLDNLAALLKKIGEKYRYGNDFTLNSLRRAIADVLIHFSVYRTYIDQNGVLESDRPVIEAVIQSAREHAPLLQHELNFIEKLLLLEYEDDMSQADKDQWLHFVMRLQQYTGPLMAKGVEDTALYVYNRLVSLNEVGGNPGRFGIALEDFHKFNQCHQEKWPQTMNTTSTHDTKRGEDVRARINVLSEIPEEWEQQVHQWRSLNQTHKTRTRNLLMPSDNDEYLIYQTLVGAFPFEQTELESFTERMQDYILKAIREAKVYTRWLQENSTYENACVEFVNAILNPTDSNSFLQTFLPFQKRIAFYGVFNSLAQTLVKITAPGVPDFYQGTELWDLSLVDPDNRRPIDFDLRQSDLDDLQKRIQGDLTPLVEDLLTNYEDGRVKLFLTAQALKARSQYLAVFQQGDYQPLEVQGNLQNHLIAFTRSFKGTTAITIAPRFLTGLLQPGEVFSRIGWQDTTICLPQGLPTRWQNVITQEPLQVENELLPNKVLASFPVALLVSR